MMQPCRILVVRRDNIGDLVCTTPLLSALRQRFPQAWLGALVNDYNAPVLLGNEDLNEVVSYRKLKHLDEAESALASLRARIRSFWSLRRTRLDYMVLATPAFVSRTLHLARWLGPRKILGFSDGSAAARALDLSLPLSQVAHLHEVEQVFALGAHFGIDSPIPPLKLRPDPASVAQARAKAPPQKAIGVHISARRPAQRWSVERYAALIERLYAEFGAASLLLWAPGAASDPRHPGDNEKARAVAQSVSRRTPDAALRLYPTNTLPELIGALSICDALICADGGAMHLAAALGKPIVALFGDSPPARWRPWGVPHRVLQPASRNVADISVEEVVEAYRALASATGAG